MPCELPTKTCAPKCWRAAVARGLRCSCITGCANGSRFALVLHRNRCRASPRGDGRSTIAATGHALGNRIDPGRLVSAKTRGGPPTTHEAHQKVKPSHLKRNAYLYVRQSTLRQVMENTEGTAAAIRFEATRGSVGMALGEDYCNRHRSRPVRARPSTAQGSSG